MDDAVKNALSVTVQKLMEDINRADRDIKRLHAALDRAADTLFNLGAHDAWASARLALRGTADD